MRWLLTGGAGYIGAHVLRVMQAVGWQAVVFDDLSSGDRRRVPDEVPLVVASTHDAPALRRTLRDYRIDGVVHLAAKKAVGESVADPLRYYRENVGGLLTLLEQMATTGVIRLVYSSSAAVYGTPAGETVAETAPTRPESPYGRTKLVGEYMVQDAATVGISSISLRYFNVVGCAEPALGDTGGQNLFPLAMSAITVGGRPAVYGADYPTRDGTCIRDYIHVEDLAEAHLAAARLVSSTRCAETVNIGCGQGHTVLEVLARIGQVAGCLTAPAVLPRRPGDPVQMVAAVDRAERLLGWHATRGLDDMVVSAWRGHRADGHHPDGRHRLPAPPVDAPGTGPARAVA